MQIYAIAAIFSRLAGYYLIFVAGLVFVGIPIAAICWAISFRKRFRNAGNEFKLFRMELSKLADEIKQLRQELKTKSTNEVSSDR